MDSIEITITHMRGGSTGADAAVLAMVRLVPIADHDPRRRGGHGIYAATSATPSRPSWERRGFIAGDRPEDIWRLVEKAAAWAANEADKLA
jgi:hypothetical protein